MNKTVMAGVLLGAAGYWASRQPGGIGGTWGRLRQGFRDIQSGQDPRRVGKRFIEGRDEEPAGFRSEEQPQTYSSSEVYQEPYRDYVTER